MSKEIEERLSEAVRKYPFLYDKTLVDFRDKRKKSLAWDDVNKETGLESKCSSLLIISIFIHYSNNYLIFKAISEVDLALTKPNQQSLICILFSHGWHRTYRLGIL